MRVNKQHNTINNQAYSWLTIAVALVVPSPTSCTYRDFPGLNIIVILVWQRGLAGGQKKSKYVYVTSLMDGSLSIVHNMLFSPKWPLRAFFLGGGRGKGSFISLQWRIPYCCGFFSGGLAMHYCSGDHKCSLINLNVRPEKVNELNI